LTSRVEGVTSMATQVFGRSFFRQEAGVSRRCGCSAASGGWGAGLRAGFSGMTGGNDPGVGFAGVAAGSGAGAAAS